MARYRILAWKEVPSLVEAFDEEGHVQIALSQRFQDLIDALAMREGASESDAYLEGWASGPDLERPGAAEAVASEVAAELEASFQDLIARRFLPSP